MVLVVWAGPGGLSPVVLRIYAPRSWLTMFLLWDTRKRCPTLSTYRRLLGQGYAKEAVKLSDKHFLALKWAAVTTGSLTEHLGTKEKIQEGYVFKVRAFYSHAF